MVRIIRHLLPQMKQREWGRLIQIGSGLASAPAATFAAYGSTKSAIVNLTVSLAKGLARTGVTANTISPGPVLTPNIEAWIKDIAGRRGGPASGPRSNAGSWPSSLRTLNPS